MITLGSKVVCKITGLAGIAVGRTEWLYGAPRVGILPPLDKDGKYLDVIWVDEGQIEEIFE